MIDSHRGEPMVVGRSGKTPRIVANGGARRLATVLAS